MDSLLEALTLHARQQPHVAALNSPSGELCYGDLLVAVNQTANRLRDLGVKRVGLCGDNTPGWIVADIACRLAGIVCVPVPGFFSEGQRQHLIEQAGLDGLLFGDAGDLDRMASQNADSPTESVWGGIVLQRLARSEYAPALPKGTSKITFTSGSTGSPRGVCLSSHHQDATARALADTIGNLGIEHHFCVLPLATLLENIAGVYLPLMLGATVHVWPLVILGFSGSSRLDPQRFAAVIDHCRPNSLILVPELAAVMIKLSEAGAFAEHRFRFLAVGGGRVSPGMLERAVEQGLPIFEGYGLSEVGSVVALNVPGAQRPGRVGRPLPHVTVQVDDGGEILVCGNSFLGYLGDGIGGQSANDCLLTGDLGHLDDEGFLTVSGRSKNLLITSFGRNINPEWLESELVQTAGARQAWVFGDGEPQPSAVITVEPERDTGEVARAITALNEALPDYARFQVVYLVRHPFTAEAGLLTPNGRLVRPALMIALPHLRRQAERLLIHQPVQSEATFAGTP